MANQTTRWSYVYSGLSIVSFLAAVGLSNCLTGGAASCVMIGGCSFGKGTVTSLLIN